MHSLNPDSLHGHSKFFVPKIIDADPFRRNYWKCHRVQILLTILWIFVPGGSVLTRSIPQRCKRNCWKPAHLGYSCWCRRQGALLTSDDTCYTTTSTFGHSAATCFMWFACLSPANWRHRALQLNTSRQRQSFGLQRVVTASCRPKGPFRQRATPYGSAIYGSVRYRAEPYTVPRVYELFEHNVMWIAVPCSHYSRLRKLQSAATERVSKSADSCLFYVTSPRESVRFRTVPVYFTWIRTFADTSVCSADTHVSAYPQGCLVPYGAVQYHGNTCVADTQCTARCPNGP